MVAITHGRSSAGHGRGRDIHHMTAVSNEPKTSDTATVQHMIFFCF